MEELFWADQYAEKIIKEKGDKSKYTVAAGMTPSGTIHLGNFREVITVDIIAKALEKKGKKVRFVYSWDDSDVFRKVPKNLPKQALLKKYLRKPLFLIPDVFETNDNYAEHNMAEFEKDLPLLNVHPEFIRQHIKYQNHEYAKEMKIALENTEKIKKILNEYRKEPLADDWLPVFVFCDKCNTDNITKLSYKGDYVLSYECKCGHKAEIDFRKQGFATLKWRTDWAMRRHKEKVDCEPAGKDHFAAGGSVVTSNQIQKEVYKTEPPFGFPYEWIAMKGGKQFASSLGQVITLSEMLEVYQPEIIRFLFAGTRPTASFEISFDMDVFKIYEDFDKCERIYYKEEKAKSEKHYLNQKRIYELSAVDNIPKKIPIQPSFRHMKNMVQIYNEDLNKVLAYFNPKNKKDKERILIRAKCAINWLKKHATDEMKFTVQKKVSDEVKKKLNAKQKKALKMIVDILEKEKLDEKELHNRFYDICKKTDLPVGEFFQGAYLVLLNRLRGPRLANFVLTLGDRALKLFREV